MNLSPDKLLDFAGRLRRSLKMDRTSEPFYCEVDEVAHDLEQLARIGGGFSRETISERRV